MEDNNELKSIRSTGKSVDEAIFKGLQQLEISIDEVTIEIIQTETKGILGIGAKPAIVQLTQRPPEEYEVPDYLKPREQRRNDRYDRVDRKRRDERPRREERKDERRDERKEERKPAAKPVEAAKPDEHPAEEETIKPVLQEVQPVEAAAEEAEPAVETAKREPRRRNRSRRERDAEASEAVPAEDKPEKVINYTAEAAEGNPAAVFVKGLIDRMGAPGQVLAATDEDCLRLRIDSEMMGVLIGHRGETLDAMQYLTSLVINRNRKTEGYTRVTLDTEDYREKREETLRRLAKKVASQVKATGRAKTLEPMNPYERRVLHSTLQNHPYVTTHSEGDEPNRRVVVTPRRKSRSGYRKPRYNERREAVNGESFAEAAVEAVTETQADE